MTAALGPYILRHPEIENTPTMENFMQQYVLKEYSSSEPYMRSVVSLPDPFQPHTTC